MGSRLNRRFVYNAETKEMEEIEFQPRSFGALVMEDIPDFVSPVDGTVVHGRAGLREHNKRNGTTNIADYSQSWAKFQAQRAEMASGGVHDESRRKERVIRAFNDLQEGRVRPKVLRERDL